MGGIFILVSVITMVGEPLISGKDPSSTEERVWFIFEVFFTGIFTIELILRFCVADALGDQTYLGFFKKPMNICDFGAILPCYMDVFFGADQKEIRLLKVTWFLRLLRLVHLGKLAKRNVPLAPVAIIMAGYGAST